MPLLPPVSRLIVNLCGFSCHSFIHGHYRSITHKNVSPLFFGTSLFAHSVRKFKHRLAFKVSIQKFPKCPDRSVNQIQTGSIGDSAVVAAVSAVVSSRVETYDMVERSAPDTNYRYSVHPPRPPNQVSTFPPPPADMAPRRCHAADLHGII